MEWTSKNSPSVQHITKLCKDHNKLTTRTIYFVEKNGARKRNKNKKVSIGSTPPFKDAMPVSFGQNCLDINRNGSEAYSRKYKKLPNIVIHAC